MLGSGIAGFEVEVENELSSSFPANDASRGCFDIEDGLELPVTKTASYCITFFLMPH